MHWRRKWQPIPVFLPGESQGRGSLVGCRLWGRTESDTTEATWQQHGVCGLPWQLSGKESTYQCKRKIPQIRKWQPTPVSLPSKSYGQGSLVDYYGGIHGFARVGHNLATKQQQQ